MLIDIAVSNPPFQVLQPRAAEELKLRMQGSAAVGRMIDMAANQSGINSRYISIPDTDDDAKEKFYSKMASIFSRIQSPA